MSELPPFTVETVQDFAEIEQEFMHRINQMVVCCAATVDPMQRPRTRILHPIWEPGARGWVFTFRHSPKAKHLAYQPSFSLAYIGDAVRPVYVDCAAEWVDELSEKQRLWELFRDTPPPMGTDMDMAFGTSYTDSKVGLLKLTPHRIEVYTLAIGTRIWRR